MNHRNRTHRRVSQRTLFLATLAAGIGLTAAYLTLVEGRGRHGDAAAAAGPLRLDEIPFNGSRAYGYLKQLCAIGPRPSGSPGMATQVKLLKNHFQKLGGRVELQRFRVRHPLNESSVPMVNLIVHWHPQRAERILLCAHYDTLPFPLRDPENPRGVFVGANDNASGVAVLMEFAHDVPKLPTKYGIDFVLLDGEEFIFAEDGRFFIGSEYFARLYAGSPPGYHYRWGVLLDMVGSKDLQIYQEGYSVRWPDTLPLVDSVWTTARRLGVQEFIAKTKHEVRDDHLMLHDVGKIPCIDIIDFDYPPWHTQADTPAQCSALSLAKVGWVIQQWLQNAP